MTSKGLQATVLVVAVVFSSSVALAQSADAFLIKRPSELRSAPGESSSSLGPLAVQTPVTRLTARQGAWVEVKTAQGTTGWVHMFDIVSATASQGSSGAGFLRSVGSLFGGKPAQTASNTGSTSTVGIRGLDAQDIANAQPNLAAVAQVESMRQDANQARSFATLAALTVQKIDPLPEPPPPGNANPGGGNQNTTGRTTVYSRPAYKESN